MTPLPVAQGAGQDSTGRVRVTEAEVEGGESVLAGGGSQRSSNLLMAAPVDPRISWTCEMGEEGYKLALAPKGEGRGERGL